MGSVSHATSNAPDALSRLAREGAIRRGAAGVGARADAVVATGIEAIDGALEGGGLPCGYICELTGPPSCGKLGLAARALARALGAGERAALVDGSRAFFPFSAELTRALARLLVCRVTSPADALVAAELLAASGGLALVAVDFANARSLGAGASAAVARLARAAREGNAAVLAVTEPHARAESLFGSAAALRIDVTPLARRVARAGGEPRLRVARSRFKNSRG
jgi:RecA/RadA recombinase